MKAMKCLECGKLFKQLEQYRDFEGKWVISGYCYDCGCYSTRPVKTEDEDEDLLEEDED